MTAAEDASPAPHTVDPIPRSAWLLVGGLFLIVTVSAFEITAVLTALPTIVDELDGTRWYGAALAAYLLATLVSTVASGEVADRRGPSIPLATGAVLFVSGLIVAGSANSIGVLIVGRVLQGLGAGAQSTLTYVIIRRAVPERIHPKVYAVMSAGWVLPSLIAPLIAGWITDVFGWRWVFLSLVPVIVTVAVVVWTRVRHIGPPDIVSQPTRLPTAVCLALGAAAISLWSTDDRVWLAVTASGLGLIVVALALHRLLPAGTFRAKPGLPAAIAARLCATAAFGLVDSFVPLAADRVHGIEQARWQGFLIIGAALTWTAGQAYAARSDQRVATHKMVVVGFVILGTGAALVAPFATDTVSPVYVFFAWAVGGLGMGILFNPTTIVAMHGTTDSDSGLVSSQINMTDFLGFALSAAYGGTLVAAAERSAKSLSGALTVTFLTGAGLAALGAVAIGRRVRVSG